MIDWLLEPFQASFMQRGLAAGLLAVLTCSVIGTWVVLRGLSFMGDALAHGIIPGIALGYLAEFNLTLGAGIAAAVTIGGVLLVSRATDLPEDTGIGLLFVGMLALGVMIIARGGSYAGDLSAILFGTVLGATTQDLVVQAVAAIGSVLATVGLYRALLVLSFDERKAASLGLRPRLANGALLALVAVAVVSSFRAVGALLVFGLLIAPPATASLVTRRVPVMMAAAVGIGAIGVTVGLLSSYQFDLAAGPAMSGAAVAIFFLLLVARELWSWGRGVMVRPSSKPAGPASEA